MVSSIVIQHVQFPFVLIICLSCFEYCHQTLNLYFHSFNSFQEFVIAYTELNGFKYFYSTVVIQFNINHLFPQISIFQVLQFVVFTLDISIMVRVFDNGPGDLGSIPGQVILKTQKMVLYATLLNTQHYKVRIKGVEQSRERSSALPNILV